MILVGMLSLYREDALALAAVESAREACDHLIVYEGPAGEPLADEGYLEKTDYLSMLPLDVYKEGRWRTDAEKRTDMIKATRTYGPPVWACWLDGDEILMNGQYLRDQLQALTWEDEHRGASIDAADPADQPYMGWPMMIVERDGSVAVCRGKVIRCDLVDHYSVSSSVYRNVMGGLHGEGNQQVLLSELPKHAGIAKVQAQAELLDKQISLLPDGPERSKLLAQLEQLVMLMNELADKLVLPPPLPGEPHLIHRSHLRHPARRGLRLHEQEATEIEKAKATGSA
jgi:hypothetical protein